jgi:hypothetical protein
MKWVLISLVLIAPTFAIGQAAQPSSKHADDEQAILRLRDALLKAHDAGDVMVLDQIEDGDFTVAGDFGELTKQQHLDSDRHREKAQGVRRKIDNERFRFYGDAALLTEIDHASDAAGKADFLTTTLWVRRGETWKITHMHYSKLAEKP